MNIAIGLMLLHMVPGLFFAVTGYRKLFIREVHNNVWRLFERLHVPIPARWSVVLGEALGGWGLLVGWVLDYRLTWAASVGLLPIMFGAFIMDTIPTVKAKKPDGVTGWISKLICTPEALLIVILLALSFILLPLDFH